MLFDQAHKNFHTAGGRYKPFATLITSDGYHISPNKQPLTVARLRPYQLLIISNAMGPISDDEVQAIHEWIADGGSLLLIVDHPPFGETTADLARSVGVEMGLAATYDPDNQTDSGLLFEEENGRRPTTRSSADATNRSTSIGC